MSGGGVRVLQRLQRLNRARPLSRYPSTIPLSPRQRRYQSTVAELHAPSPRTLPRQTGGIQTGMSRWGEAGLIEGSLLGTPAPMGPAGGPNARYEMLLHQGRLREDSHQKGIKF